MHNGGLGSSLSESGKSQLQPSVYESSQLKTSSSALTKGFKVLAEQALIPTLQINSPTAIPCSACFRMTTICSTEKRFFLIGKTAKPRSPHGV